MKFEKGNLREKKARLMERNMFMCLKNKKKNRIKRQCHSLFLDKDFRRCLWKKNKQQQKNRKENDEKNNKLRGKKKKETKTPDIAERSSLCNNPNQ